MGVNIGLDGAFLMVGIIFTITGVGLSVKFKHDKMRCSLEVPFEIVKWTCRKHRDSDGHISKHYYATYRYVANGMEYIVKSTIGRSSRHVKQTTLRVNPDNPREIYENIDWLGYLFTGLGIVLTLVGVAIKIQFNWW